MVIDAICDGFTTGNLLSIPTTCVHCFVTFCSKIRSIVCITTQQEFSRNFPRLSDPWKVSQPHSEHSTERMIHTFLHVTDIAQHHYLPLITSVTNTLTRVFPHQHHRTILCIVYTFYTHFPPYDILAVIFHPTRNVMVLWYGKFSRGKFSSLFSVLVENSLLPMSPFSVFAVIFQPFA